MAEKRSRGGSSARPDGDGPREGRIRRHLRIAGEVGKDPKRLYPLLREVFVSTWRSRGGGFYGLGYVIAFVTLEIRMLLGDIVESDTLGDFAIAQLLEYLFRVGFLSFVNALLALLWPFFVLEHSGWLGIILLAAGYVGFEYALKPLVEQHVPELRTPVSPRRNQ